MPTELKYISITIWSFKQLAPMELGNFILETMFYKQEAPTELRIFPRIYIL